MEGEESQKMLHQAGSETMCITLMGRSVTKGSHGAEAVINRARKYILPQSVTTDIWEQNDIVCHVDV